MNNNNLSFHSILKNGYSKKKADNLNGYILDKGLSNDNQQTYYNPTNKKLLFNINGTHNLSDVITDGYLAVGHLKDTSRYKESHKALRDAKAKYGVQSSTVTGHSLGASIAGYIASKKDRVLTLDKGATIGQRVRNNETAYRSSGDLVSALNANSKHAKTLSNSNGGSLLGTIGKVAVGLATGNFAPIVSAGKDVLNSHNVDNIKDEAIFV